MLAALDFVGEDQFQELRVVEFFLAGISLAVGQSGQQPESFKRFSTVFSSGGICMRASLIINEVVSGRRNFNWSAD